MNPSVQGILEAAKQHRIQITLDGETLKLRAPCEPPPEILEQLRQWKQHIIMALLEPRFIAWTFMLDGSTKVTAIRPQGAHLEEMQRLLIEQFGNGRVSDLTGQKMAKNTPLHP